MSGNPPHTRNRKSITMKSLVKSFPLFIEEVLHRFRSSCSLYNYIEDVRINVVREEEVRIYTILQSYHQNCVRIYFSMSLERIWKKYHSLQSDKTNTYIILIDFYSGIISWTLNWFELSRILSKACIVRYTFWG